MTTPDFREQSVRIVRDALTKVKYEYLARCDSKATMADALIATAIQTVRSLPSEPPAAGQGEDADWLERFAVSARPLAIAGHMQQPHRKYIEIDLHNIEGLHRAAATLRTQATALQAADELANHLAVVTNSETQLPYDDWLEWLRGVKPLVDAYRTARTPQEPKT